MLKKLDLMFLAAFLLTGFFFLATPQKSRAGFAQISVTCCQQEGSCYDNSEGGGAIACPDGMFVEDAICEEPSGMCVSQVSPITSSVPTLSEWGLIAMAGVLGIAGYIIVRRRKVNA